jgi:bifunctional DNA-binding transcriptional regulator/antitoxin component of YhaV-PrlF toxin-antitoxin module
MTMPRSTITSKRQTTVPKEVCEALDVGPGGKITWEVNGGRVAVTTERPAFWRWVGSVKGGPDDPVQAVAEARKRRGRI